MTANQGAVRQRRTYLSAAWGVLREDLSGLHAAIPGGRMRDLAISITSGIMLLVLATACSRRPSDETIAKDIQTKAAADPDTRDSEVSVAAKDGKVTLSGKVKTQVAQQKLEQIAREEPGANGVDDQTAVVSAAAVPEPNPVP